MTYPVNKISANQMTNLMALYAFMQTVPEDSFTDGLWTFRKGGAGKPPSCGSPACLMGWLPYVPHFKELGVVPSTTGVPVMKDGVEVSPLLGVTWLAQPVYQPWGEEQGKEKAAVLARLKHCIQNNPVVSMEFLTDAWKSYRPDKLPDRLGKVWSYLGEREDGAAVFTTLDGNQVRSVELYYTDSAVEKFPSLRNYLRS